MLITRTIFDNEDSLSNKEYVWFLASEVIIQSPPNEIIYDSYIIIENDTIYFRNSKYGLDFNKRLSHDNLRMLRVPYYESRYEQHINEILFMNEHYIICKYQTLSYFIYDSKSDFYINVNRIENNLEILETTLQ